MLEPEIAAFAAKSDAAFPPGAESWPIARLRAAYDAYAGSVAPHAPSGVARTDGVRGGVRVRHYGAPGRGVIVYLHGGGFVLGSLDSHDALTARLAADTGAAVIAVDYRLAPENAHPAALEDALAVAEDVLAGGEPMALMGDSAGATLAAGVALALPPNRLAALVTVYGAFAPDPTPPARDTEADAPMLTLASVRAYYDAYLGGQQADARAFPLLADWLGGLPPTLALAVEHDPLRDDSRLLIERARADGVDARLWIGGGLVHGCLRAIDVSPGAGALWREAIAFLRERLGNGQTGIARAD